MGVAETEAIRLKLEQLRELDQGKLSLDLDNTQKSPPGTWRWLSEHPEDAAELAELLNEAAPTLGLQNYPKLTPPRTPLDLPRWQTVHASTLLKERLHAAVPIPSSQIDWSKLNAIITSETLAFEELGGPEDSTAAAGDATTPDAGAAHSKVHPFKLPTTPGGSLVEVNSGGRVLFCLFTLEPQETDFNFPPNTATSSSPPREGCVVLKFVSSRLLCQSEQFANELARHVGICSPETRIVRAAASSSDPEWSDAVAAAERIQSTHPELLEEINECTSFLVMEYIPGKGLFRTPLPFQPFSAAQNTFSDIGRLFALDMLLGNADRLSCQALGWRGNDMNILCATSGRWEGRLVAIDAVVQRRPPGGLLSAEDAACEQLVELMLNDQEIAEKVLSEAIASSPAAIYVLEDPTTTSTAVKAFQNGLRRGLQATEGLKGLLEMMFEVVTEWIDEFIDDIEGIVSSPPVPPNTARRIGSAGTNSSLTTQNSGGSGGGVNGNGGNGSGGLLTTTGSGNMGSFNTSAINSTINSTNLNSIGATLASSIPTQTLQSPAVTTFKIRRINLEATHNRSVGDKVSEWKTIFRTKAEDLRAAVEEWQAKRGHQHQNNNNNGGYYGTYNYQKERSDSDADDEVDSTASDYGKESNCTDTLSRNSSGRENVDIDRKKKFQVGGVSEEDLDRLAALITSPRSAAASSGAKLTTGFLDGTAPIVDIYELKVRLEHMLQRLRVLQQASATARPTRLLPGLYLSGAVEASSLHVLRHYGITHILNATEDLLLPEETQCFVGMRIPLRDVEEEDISPYFAPAATFIDSALENGGGVLVHCHAGRSRSCSLVLAWLMTRRKWTLKQALEFLHEHRPQAAPNAGYLQQLSALEAQLFGTQTVKVKKTKPAPRKCPECGDTIGLSAESVRVHLRLKHPTAAHAYFVANT